GCSLKLLSCGSSRATLDDPDHGRRFLGVLRPDPLHYAAILVRLQCSPRVITHLLWGPALNIELLELGLSDLTARPGDGTDEAGCFFEIVVPSRHRFHPRDLESLWDLDPDLGSGD